MQKMARPINQNPKSARLGQPRLQRVMPSMGGMSGPSNSSYVPQTGGGLVYNPQQPSPSSPAPNPGQPINVPGVGNTPNPTENPYKIGGYDPFSMFKGIYDQATAGSTTALNTASNRLRERVDAATAGNVDAVRNQNLSRGFGASGINDAGMARERAQGMNAYAQGLSGLEQDFEGKRLQGLGIANQAAGGIQGGMQGYNQLLFNLLGQNIDADTRKRIAELVAQTQNIGGSLDLADSLGGSGGGGGGGSSYGGGVNVGYGPHGAPGPMPSGGSGFQQGGPFSQAAMDFFNRYGYMPPGMT